MFSSFIVPEDLSLSLSCLSSGFRLLYSSYSRAKIKRGRDPIQEEDRDWRKSTCRNIIAHRDSFVSREIIFIFFIRTDLFSLSLFLCVELDVACKIFFSLI